MPWILWRHLIGELLKVVLLTASVIVVVVAFGAAIKPLAENSLGPGSVLKYVALAMVPMLQFALPFAGGFAATIVLHRFAADNELVAMSASGLRHRVIMTPVVAVGVALLVVMLWLVDSVVPRFWGLMRETVAQDATAVFVAAVERGEALDAGDMVIYADSVEVQDAPADSGAARRLVLTGVAAIQRGKAGESGVEFVGERAVVDVHFRDGATVMKMAMSNGTGFRADEGTVAFVPRATPDAVELGRAEDRDARSTPTRELRRVRRNLDAEQPIQDVMARGMRLLDRRETLACIERSLDAVGSVTLLDEVGRRAYRIEGARILGRQHPPHRTGRHPGRAAGDVFQGQSPVVRRWLGRSCGSGGARGRGHGRGGAATAAHAVAAAAARPARAGMPVAHAGGTRLADHPASSRPARGSGGRAGSCRGIACRADPPTARLGGPRHAFQHRAAGCAGRLRAAGAPAGCRAGRVAT
ncbi:MAG: LptF/LptG family permease [Phycisphaerales bacterium]